MTLRGKQVEHHDIVKDMMMSKTITYKPKEVADGMVNNNEVSAVLQLGFVKDAHHHIDVQGFNVYHKNRLIKPFWRVWNAAGSDGRGVIGVLEANFIEPAHDKQGFERTISLSRLENRLKEYQKDFWTSNCHDIGYAPRRPIRKGGYSNASTSSQPPKQQLQPRLDINKSPVPQESVCRENKQLHYPTMDHVATSSEETPRSVITSPKHVDYHDETESAGRSSRKRGAEEMFQSLAEERVKNKELETQVKEMANELEKLKQQADKSSNDVKALTEELEREKEWSRWNEAEKQTLREKIDDLEKKVKKLELQD
ncbi:Protein MICRORCHIDIA 7 [Linum grandiflorum]